MTFSVSWHTLLDELDSLPEGATLITPLSHERFRIIDFSEQQVVIEFLDRDIDETQQLHRDQFETLYRRITNELNGFDLDRLPPNAEPYAAVLSVQSGFEIDEESWIMVKTETQSASPFVEYDTSETNKDPQKPDLDPTIKKMIDNMGDPQGRVSCPIEGCDYSHQSAASVARHVSGSSTGKHIWENTDYAGWRDFVQKHGESTG